MPKLTNELDTLLSRLANRMKDRVSTDVEALAKVACDESGLPPGIPGAVAWPQSTDEVVLIAKEAAALGVPLIPGVPEPARPAGVFRWAASSWSTSAA